MKRNVISMNIDMPALILFFISVIIYSSGVRASNSSLASGRHVVKIVEFTHDELSSYDNLRFYKIQVDDLESSNTIWTKLHYVQDMPQNDQYPYNSSSIIGFVADYKEEEYVLYILTQIHGQHYMYRIMYSDLTSSIINLRSKLILSSLSFVPEKTLSPDLNIISNGEMIFDIKNYGGPHGILSASSKEYSVNISERERIYVDNYENSYTDFGWPFQDSILSSEFPSVPAACGSDLNKVGYWFSFEPEANVDYSLFTSYPDRLSTETLTVSFYDQDNSLLSCHSIDSNYSKISLPTVESGPIYFNTKSAVTSQHWQFTISSSQTHPGTAFANPYQIVHENGSATTGLYTEHATLPHPVLIPATQESVNGQLMNVMYLSRSRFENDLYPMQLTNKTTT
ncbi:MAG: hypothetical protein SFY68_14150 [Candidatus Sumerlaeia bacterium]|nr:hypothetical protein [Candidatus Sumerlaeia bacterium]